MANKFKAGDEVQFTDKAPNYLTGKFGKIISYDYDGTYRVYLKDDSSTKYVKSNCMELRSFIDKTNVLLTKLYKDKEHHTSQIAELKNKIIEIDKKISYINNSGSETFDPKEYKVYLIGEITKSDVSEKLKREKIMELL